MKIKNEHLFLEFCPSHSRCNPTKEGRNQFFFHQSNGIKPDDPDPYYIALDLGKTSFDTQCRNIQQSWLNGDGIYWGGLVQLARDWKGKKWVLKHLLKWHPKNTRYNRYKDPK